VEDVLSQSISKWLLRETSVFGIRSIPETRAAIATSKGEVRQQNQDRVVVATFESGVPREAFKLLAVCDGVGGMQDGAGCASLAIANVISALIYTRAVVSGETRLRLALNFANRGVLDAYKENGGTTVAAVLLSPSFGPVACSVGDTRIYLTNSGGELKQLTIDDTIAGRVAALTNEKSVAGGPFGNRLAQYIGQRAELSPQILHLASDFEMSGRFNDAGKKGILIATDGVHRLPADLIDRISKIAKTPRDLVARLVYVADWSGGSDNASALYFDTAAGMQSMPVSSKFVRLVVQDSFGDREFMISRNELPQPIDFEALNTRVADEEALAGDKRGGTTYRIRKKSKYIRKKKSSSSNQPELSIEVTSVSESRK
jgi:serine/threonine protein phosphatase PrpC